MRNGLDDLGRSSERSKEPLAPGHMGEGAVCGLCTESAEHEEGRHLAPRGSRSHAKGYSIRLIS